MITTPAARAVRRIRPDTYLYFIALFAVLLFATHAALLRLPFYWDELGQFVPAARDLWTSGAWVPHSAVPNAHPPAVAAYLAVVWSVFGYSVAATRTAMLALAALGAFFAFLLAIELGRGAPGAPAFAAAVFLCASPLFFSQAVMAQLDMPAMLFTTVALLLFLQERMVAAAATCVALVMVKETGLLVPAVLGGWLLYEKRWRDAALFAAPLAPLAAWFAALHTTTGQMFGDAGFTHYNLLYPLHPVRLPVAFARRLNYLFVSDFHWVGTAALVFAWRRSRVFASRPWKVAWLLVAAHIIGLTLAGGAVLERYLLPVLPILYAGMAAAMMFLPGGLRAAAIALLAVGLAAGNFWNPPHPVPAREQPRVDRLRACAIYRGALPGAALPWRAHRRRMAPGARAGGAELRLCKPAARRQDAARPGARNDQLTGLERTPVLALFSHSWDPAWNYFRWPPVRRLRMRFWDYREDITPLEVQAHLPLQLVARWSQGGWWVEIYEWEGSRPGNRTATIKAANFPSHTNR